MSRYRARNAIGEKVTSVHGIPEMPIRRTVFRWAHGEAAMRSEIRAVWRRSKRNAGAKADLEEMGRQGAFALEREGEVHARGHALS